MLLHNNWATPETLGSKGKSKTLQVKDFDGELQPWEKPTLTYLTSRAWMIWRASRSSFLSFKTARKLWHEQEVEKLRSDVAALGVSAGGTGSLKADQYMRDWCPAVLEP